MAGGGGFFWLPLSVSGADRTELPPASEPAVFPLRPLHSLFPLSDSDDDDSDHSASPASDSRATTVVAEWATTVVALAETPSRHHHFYLEFQLSLHRSEDGGVAVGLRLSDQSAVFVEKCMARQRFSLSDVLFTARQPNGPTHSCVRRKLTLSIKPPTCYTFKLPKRHSATLRLDDLGKLKGYVRFRLHRRTVSRIRHGLSRLLFGIGFHRFPEDHLALATWALGHVEYGLSGLAAEGQLELACADQRSVYMPKAHVFTSVSDILGRACLQTFPASVVGLCLEGLLFQWRTRDKFDLGTALDWDGLKHMAALFRRLGVACPETTAVFRDQLEWAMLDKLKQREATYSVPAKEAVEFLEEAGRNQFVRLENCALVTLARAPDLRGWLHPPAAGPGSRRRPDRRGHPFARRLEAHGLEELAFMKSLAMDGLPPPRQGLSARFQFYV